MFYSAFIQKFLSKNYLEALWPESMTENKLSFFHPAKLIGTWFGAGLAPKAPGTVGSLAALPFAYVIHVYGSNDALLLASLIAFVVGWIATNSYLTHTDAKDPKEIVIDEVAGMWFLLSFMYPTWESYLVGFALFRFFDVVKPWPVSWADKKVKGGLGVMLDDIFAAAYPITVLALIIIVSVLMGHRIGLDPLVHVLGG